MNNGFYKYVVEFYDEDIKDNIKSKGVTYASSYQEAAYNIENYYGSIANMSLEELEEGDVFEIEDDI